MSTQPGVRRTDVHADHPMYLTLLRALPPLLVAIAVALLMLCLTS